MTNEQRTKEIRQIDKRLSTLKRQRDRLVHSSITQAERKRILHETAGMLKGRLPKDLVAFQRKMRDEWSDREPRKLKRT